MRRDLPLVHDEEILNVDQVEKKLVSELGNNVCVYERICAKYATQTLQKRSRERVLDWDIIFRYVFSFFSPIFNPAINEIVSNHYLNIYWISYWNIIGSIDNYYSYIPLEPFHFSLQITYLFLKPSRYYYSSFSSILLLFSYNKYPFKESKNPIDFQESNFAAKSNPLSTSSTSLLYRATTTNDFPCDPIFFPTSTSSSYMWAKITKQRLKKKGSIFTHATHIYSHILSHIVSQSPSTS